MNRKFFILVVWHAQIIRYIQEEDLTRYLGWCEDSHVICCYSHLLVCTAASDDRADEIRVSGHLCLKEQNQKHDNNKLHLNNLTILYRS